MHFQNEETWSTKANHLKGQSSYSLSMQTVHNRCEQQSESRSFKFFSELSSAWNFLFLKWLHTKRYMPCFWNSKVFRGVSGGTFHICVKHITTICIGDSHSHLFPRLEGVHTCRTKTAPHWLCTSTWKGNGGSLVNNALNDITVCLCTSDMWIWLNSWSKISTKTTKAVVQQQKQIQDFGQGGPSGVLTPK